MDQESFDILVIGVSFAVLALGITAILSLSGQGMRWISKRRALDRESSVVMEDDVVDMIGHSDIRVGLDEVEIVNHEPQESGENSGQDSRRARRERRTSEDQGGPISELSLPDPLEDEVVEPTPFLAIAESVQVACLECGSRFQADSGVSAAKCPVCGSRVNL